MKYVFIILSVCIILSCTENESTNRRLIDYVDPFIGTGGKGKTYPGATVPFGKVQLSPDNGRNGWDWISGYFYPDSIISGFSHTHLSGTGIGDLYDISFLPTSGKLKSAILDTTSSNQTVYSGFSHQNESASPGFYQVYLDDYKINVELTATQRTGLQRYTFEGQDNKVRLHLGYSKNWDKTTAGFLGFLNDTTIIGFRHSDGWAKGQKVYFISVFSEPVKSYQLFNEGQKMPQGKIKGNNILAICDFGDTKELMIKTAISSVSVENATQNLQIEQKTFDFEKTRSAAEFIWETELQKVNVKAHTYIKINFYTAMYHSLLAPTIYSDVEGSYYGPNKAINNANGFKRYSTFSLWDTFRAQHPWLTITQKERVTDMMKSILAFKDESGLLPVWNLMGSETQMMIGYHAVPVLTDAILKGFPVDTLNAFIAMKETAMQNGLGLEQYKRLGYVPYEFGDWNVSMTMEYAYDDWCIAQVAKLLGKNDDYDYFMSRSENYLNHFDPNSVFFRARSETGVFKPDFDPLAYHPADFCEANAWQYYWYVPHNIEKLIDLTGSPALFEEKLDSMFITPQSFEVAPEWISGYIGQYVHGNEPSHHIPYLYQYAGKPHKTEKTVRQILTQLYSTSPDGLAGNEDCGQLSAWYIFSALGFYPVNPADGKYVFGSPVLEEAIINLGSGKRFKVKVINQGESNVYVESVTLNGEPLGEIFITHDQIMSGGELIFKMTDEIKKQEI